MISIHLDIKDFTRLDITGVFRFEILKSDTYSVDIDQAWYKNTRAFKEGNMLVIDHPWYDVIGWFTPWITPTVKVGMPELKDLSISGATRGSVAGFKSSGDFKLKVRGASQLTGDFDASTATLDIAGASKTSLNMSTREFKLKIAGASELKGSLKAEKGELIIAGASKTRLSGMIGEAVIKAEGASRLEMGELTVRNASVRLAGASNCTLNIETKLDAELAGASRLVYGGTPVMGNIKTVGASTLSKK